MVTIIQLPEGDLVPARDAGRQPTGPAIGLGRWDIHIKRLHGVSRPKLASRERNGVDNACHLFDSGAAWVCFGASDLALASTAVRSNICAFPSKAAKV